MKSIRSALIAWAKQTDSFQKLQQAYICIAIIALLIAGTISLVNYRLGQSILFVSLFTSLVFISNGVVWSLINTYVTQSAASKKPSSSKTARK